MTDTLMDGGSLHPGSKSVLNPQLKVFTVPPTDLSMASYCIVPIQTYTTGINPGRGREGDRLKIEPAKALERGRERDRLLIEPGFARKQSHLVLRVESDA